MLKKLSFIIPVYNSEKSLFELYERIRAVFDPEQEIQYEIIMVDDGSADNSFDQMNKIRKMDNRVKIIQLARNFGQQNAIICGLHFAQGDAIITLDDDLQHPPEEIPKLLNKLDEGYDVIFGIPEEKKHPNYRNLGTILIRFLLNIICDKPKDVAVSSFRAMQGDVVKKIILDKTSFVYIAPMIFKVTTNVEHVFVKHDYRKYGKSNYNLYKLIKIIVKLIIYYSQISYFVQASPSQQFEIKTKKI